MRLSPLVTLLVEDKLLDHTIDSLCKSLNKRAILEIINAVNTHDGQKLWYSEHKVSSIYVGGGSRYRSSRRIIHMDFDRNKEGVWPRSFLYFLLCVIHLKPEFVLDLSLSLPSSPKYFSLLSYKGTECITLLKFRKEHLGSMFYAFTTLLYSGRNQKKRLRFKLSELTPFDSNQWD